MYKIVPKDGNPHKHHHKHVLKRFTTPSAAFFFFSFLVREEREKPLPNWPIIELKKQNKTKKTAVVLRRLLKDEGEGEQTLGRSCRRSRYRCDSTVLTPPALP